MSGVVASPAGFGRAAAAGVGEPELRSCHACGRLQAVPPLPPGAKAECARCGAHLVRRVRNGIERALALQWAALFLFLVANAFPIMTLEIEGRPNSSTLLSAARALYDDGAALLAATVLLVGTALPALKVLGSLYVLSSVHNERPRPGLALVFRLIERSRPWAMIEVYSLGLIVAYVKLGDLALVELGTAAIAFVTLILVLIAADAVLEPAEVWRRIDEQARPSLPFLPRDAVSCHVCQQVLLAPEAESGRLCPRCGAGLHRRKPDSINRTTALVATAACLYVPANALPILTAIYFGAGQPDTIMSGIEELVTTGQYPIAALVFFASVLVPLLKLIGLSFLIVSVRRKWRTRPRDRARLYHTIEWIGRWSMIDVFLVGILAGIVDHGNLAMVVPELGAVAFAAVVVTTMLASMAFDPRLIWDALDERGGDAEQARA